MTWRTVVIANRAKLDLKLNHLVIRQVDKVTKVFLGEIALLIIESTAVSFTGALISELINRKIKVIFCDDKRNPAAELISYYGSYDSSNKIQRQIEWNDDFKGSLWKEIIYHKIFNQKEVLRKTGSSQYHLLKQYLSEIQWNDDSNREGHAAKVYFNALFGIDFSRTLDTPINAALNYGYSLLLSAVNREIKANGYITQLGIFHHNMFNHFNLGSDLMEPFRPLVDQCVLDLMPEKFEVEEKRVLQDLLNQSVYIDYKKQVLLNAIKIYCKSVFDALDQDDLSCVRFYRNEL